MKRDDFELQWQRRQQAMNDAESHAPTDDWMLGLAEHAKEKATGNEVQYTRQRRFRWIPYVAAAGLLLAVSIIGMRHQRNAARLPAAEKVDVRGQTIRFLCNSGCSADDVVQSAYGIMIQ